MTRKNHPLIKIINSSLIDLPAPINISLWWNYGSKLGICLMLQIITGLFLTMNYSTDMISAFNSVTQLCANTDNGWKLRMMHANGASLFFLCLYIHAGRGMYYQSFKCMETWTIGVILLFITMGTAFMGYVLPWGQMSFWGATVITNLLSTVPVLGIPIVQWLWGGFSVDSATLNRFFVIHFLLPFLIAAFTMIHLLFLHQTGSNNPLGLNSNPSKIPFNSYYLIKDSMGFSYMLGLFLLLVMSAPYLLGDPDNFTPANPMVTPVHIQPEWYFLFAYAILRSIPSKLGGTIALALSIAILFILPAIYNNNFQGTQYYLINKFFFWSLLISVILLTWIGMSPMEAPYMTIGKLLTVIYFSYYITSPLIKTYWDYTLKN